MDPAYHNNPMAVKDFQRLIFQYPDTFAIDIGGKRGSGYRSPPGRAAQKQAQFNRAVPANGSKKQRRAGRPVPQYTDLINRKKELQDKLALLPAHKELEKQKAESKRTGRHWTGI